MIDYQEKKKIFQKIEGISRKKGGSTLFKDFSSILFSQASLEDLTQYTPDDLFHIASHGLKTYEAKGKNTHLIKVYAPQKEMQGWHQPCTVIEIAHKHIPFLADSLYTALVSEKRRISIFLHSILKTTRSSEGMLENIELGKASLGEKDIESFLYIQLEDQLSEDEITLLLDVLEAVVQNSLIAVEDWRPMRARVQENIRDLEKLSAPLEVEKKKEYRDFLKWLDDGFFTFLGYRFYEVKSEKISALPEQNLGITKIHKGSFFGLDRRTEEKILNQTLHEKSYFSITKTMVQSKVHRPVPMDVIRITAFDEQGIVSGEHQFFGLFTASVYNARIQDIPLLQTKVSEALSLCHIQEDWYEGRRLIYILESFPRDILFQIPPSELARIGQALLHSKERHKLSAFVMPDPLGHFIFSLVYVPRDRYTAALSIEMGEMLADCYKGAMISHETHIGGDLSFARVHYIISTDAHPQHKIVCDINSTEIALSELSLSWEERLSHLLKEEGVSVRSDFENPFSSAYQERFPVSEALKDLPFIKKSLENSFKHVRLYQVEEAGKLETHLKIFSPIHGLFLSDLFPILENMGLRILTEASYKIGKRSDIVWIYHFRADPLKKNRSPFEVTYKNFLDVLEKALHKKVEDDSFNRLVISSNLSSHQVMLMRAYYRYMRQIGWPHTRVSIVSVLEKHADILKNLGRLFYAQFEPKSNRKETDILSALKEGLNEVENTEEEMILSGFLTLIRSTQRTNFFQKDKSGQTKEYISLKFAPALIEPLQDMRPLYEVFVYAPWVEALHLRSGKVARGGIRWSDRRADYRKEVLELVKAQIVKNAVIVPMGAKGGFYVKTSTDHLSFSEKQEVGIHAYKTMIRGLLDITDNWVDGKVVPPLCVERRDGDDPYLVVAADKGTATFSDIANKLSQEYGFWMGDAFASGGSAGYDHKKMGITSRGAWESVKRHFKELEKNIEKPFTTVGVGDMSGDVFGNGMLLSNQIQLIAAFNHSHIFIDPNPCVSKSYTERKRLFNKARSQWPDYSEDLISKGGGVFERRAKIIKISQEAQVALNISTAEIKPDTLIQHILKAPVDLLWFGGIGTYIKDQKESDLEAGDRANDTVRIDGHKVQAQILGEGANLAITQKGRIAYAMKGGKINRDSVDNAAGVDCSDYEVNIKILFQSIIKSGALDEEKRNVLLEEMTSEVASLVLKHNYHQTQAISMIESRGYKALGRQNRLMRFLESSGRLDREREALPSEEVIERRVTKKVSLTRPEISVLVSYAKLYLYEEILKSSLPDQPFFQYHLKNYLPKPLQKNYDSFILRHPLKRELIATSEANILVNRLGATSLLEIERRSGKPLIEIISLFAEIRNIFDLESCWGRIESLDGFVPYSIQNKLLSLLVLFSEEALIYFLKKETDSSLEKIKLKINLKDIKSHSTVNREGLDNLDMLIQNLREEKHVNQNSFISFIEKFKETLS
jgi:glutamate dehydrogenase